MSTKEILDKASTLKIAVIGDYMLDRYIFGDVDRVSPEAPVIVLNKKGQRESLGGAGNVFMNLIGLGVDAYLFSCGGSSESDAVFIHPGRVPIKTRVMSDNHHILRIDEEDTDPQYIDYDDVHWKEDFERILALGLDAVVFSDYHKGMISASIARTIITMCNEANIPVIVDAKRDFGKYNGSTVIKCNRKAFCEILSQFDIRPLDVRKMFECKYFVQTMGEGGISVYYESVNSFEELVEDGEGFNSPKVDIVDVCGAGDTVTAVIALMYAAGVSIVRSAEIANIAAAESCRHPGVYAITKEDLLRLC